MLKKIAVSSFFIFLFILCGCQSSVIKIASPAGDPVGGVYLLCDKKVVQAIRLPGVNYLISSGKCDFATASIRSATPSPARGVIAVITPDRSGGTLKLTQIADTGGRTPCHLTLSPDGRFVYAANYSSGDISEFRFDGEKLLTPARLIRHRGKSILPRQRAPHPHFTGFAPDNSELFVCDLGTDEIWIYAYSPETGIQLPCKDKLALPPGSGPRHLVFSPDGNAVYVANELNSTVTSFFRPDKNSPWQPGKTASTLLPGKNLRNFPGAIKITSCGKFFFVTNRGDDTTAIFRTGKNGDFQLLDTISSGGSYPSDILLSPDEKFLWIVNMKSSNLVCFYLDKARASLVRRPGEVKIPRAMSLIR